MKTKEAIEKINYNDFSTLPLDDGRKIISLLQQGEKYRQMWNEIATTYKLPCYGLENSSFLEIIKYLEQKYFPKGEDKQ